MLSNVFSFWIGVISTWVSWLFTLKINENPDITIGMFLLGCATIGLVLYFILGTDFIPNITFNHSSSNKSNNNGYQPRHAKGSYRPKHGKE